MEKIIALICVVGMLCTLSLSVFACGPDFDSLDEIINGSDKLSVKVAVIITGVAIEKELIFREFCIYERPATITTIRTTNVLLGNVMVDESIELIAWGHSDYPSNGTDEGPHLDVGQEYLFFLHEVGYSSFPFGDDIEGRYSIWHSNLIYGVDNNGNIINTGNMIIDHNPFKIDTVDMIRKFIFARPGYILSPNDNITILDVLEILKYLVGMDSVIIPDTPAYYAALIVSENKPTILDALEILKHLVGMDSKVTA